MSMSATSVPHWKQNLLDKKRRHEEETRRLEKEEVEKFSSLPNWKRDLLLKRHGQKNSVVFVGRRKSSEESPERRKSNCDGEAPTTLMSHGEEPQKVTNHIVAVEAIVTEKGSQASEQHVSTTSKGNREAEEHLLPVKDNPWLKADPIKKKRFSDIVSSHRSHSNENQFSNHHSWSEETDIVKDMRQVPDDVFEEEVTYGKGFVHKLLRKFSHLSGNETRGRKSSRNSSSKRSHSAENLLDDRNHYSATSRETSPSGSCCDSLSPRSPARSRSTDSLSSPRPPNDENPQTNKVLLDKSGLTTSVYNSQERGQHSPVLNSSGSALLSPSWENISEPEDQLPKKNIVASTRNVFENIVSPKISLRKPSLETPKPARSPRNSVHTLIAVEKSLEDGQQSPTSPSVQLNGKSTLVDVRKSDHSTGVSGKAETVQDSKKLVSVTEKEKTSGVTENTLPKDTVQQCLPIKDTKNVSVVSENKSEENKSAGAPSYFDLYFKTSSSSANGTKASSLELSNDLVNGDISYDVLDHANESSTDVVTSQSGSSYKKRKAPLPPKPAKDTDKSSSVGRTSYSVDNSCAATNSAIKTNGVVDPERKRNNTKNVAPAVSQCGQSGSKTVSSPVTQPRRANANVDSSSASDAKRQNLSLNLNDVSPKKPEVVKSSTGSSNDAFSVINSNRNKKAKIVTPKSSSGPGSLLIRPASNMIHVKNAQFAQLEFKYDDIRTGDFAPPKKKPSYYDDETDSDEDIPVTNIDDVIDERVAKSDVKSDGKTSRDRNANISKGKYEFIGAGVVSGKSSLAKRRKETKMTIQFDDHNSMTYEYPSEQYLMSETPARPGDYDYVDANAPVAMVNGTHDYDSDDDETMTVDVEQVTTKSLKSNPGVASSASLSGYQSKMQFEYHFGMNVNEEPAQKEDRKVVKPEMTENEGIKPADEDQTANWSETQSSDMLF